ncbi:hypothetical protein QBC41DRAFT_395909 [Cercophora samala]|uniref:Transmembrane protein n=1 Tax=Cercophora samala TaxID=330535 RepID=A0AA39ZBS9_9PEZI|nr:hypothetical protein QBC41DRAFT_395909 [Cercophora samala]
MAEAAPSSDQWFMKLTGNESTSIIVVIIIGWAAISSLMTLCMLVWRPPPHSGDGPGDGDDNGDCENFIRVLREECCLFPCYFMAHFFVVFLVPPVVAIILGVSKLGCVGIKVMKMIGIKKCCGVEWDCLKTSNKNKNMDLDLEAGNGNGDGRENEQANSEVGAEGPAPGAGVVSSPLRPEVAMVARPEPARTQAPNVSRTTPAQQPRSGIRRQSTTRTASTVRTTHTASTAGATHGSGLASQQSRINTSAARRSLLQSPTLTAENLSILHHSMVEVESSQTGTRERGAATRGGDQTPPPRYEELDTRNTRQQG